MLGNGKHKQSEPCSFREQKSAVISIVSGIDIVPENLMNKYSILVAFQSASEVDKYHL